MQLTLALDGTCFMIPRKFCHLGRSIHFDHVARDPQLIQTSVHSFASAFSSSSKHHTTSISCSRCLDLSQCLRRYPHLNPIPSTEATSRLTICDSVEPSAIGQSDELVDIHIANDYQQIVERQHLWRDEQCNPVSRRTLLASVVQISLTTAQTSGSSWWCQAHLRFDL